MILVYSFIGKLPHYIIETLYQCRLFFNGTIYLIIDDLQSEFISKIKFLNINIIEYNDVRDNDFLQIAQMNKHKFVTITKLGERSLLFLRAFERFFLLLMLMQKKQLENVFFIELDNLIYDDPKRWLQFLSDYTLAFMIDNKDRIGSGIFYAKNHKELAKLTSIYKQYIVESDSNTEFVCEMHANAFAMKKLKSLCILPTIFPDSTEAQQIPQMAENFAKFGNMLFDSSAYGIYLLGLDPYHTDGKIVLHRKNPGALIDCSKYQLEWRFDPADGLRKPYMKLNNQWILIVNLHVHSKDLFAGLSKPLQNRNALFYYGNSDNLFSVTKEAEKAFCSLETLKIAKDVIFNDLFGDVLPNHHKMLHIRFLDDETTVFLPENRLKDFYLTMKPPFNVFGNDNSETNGEKWFYETRIKDQCHLIFDIGCRYDSLMTSSPHEVHYFDPCPEFISRLQQVSTKNKKSIFNNFGLGERNETLIFYEQAQSFLNREKSCPWLDNSNTKILEIKSAKDYVLNHVVDTIDFIKIDTEGYEMTIINGFGDCIERVKIIQFEYGGCFIDAKVTLQQICEKLKSHGFVNFCYLSANALVPMLNFHDHYQYCNIVCFNKKFSFQ